MKGKRARAEILRYLENFGESNIHDIHHHLKCKYRHSPSMNQLVNFLSKSPDVEKCERRDGTKSIISGNYEVTVWRLRGVYE